MNHVSQVVLPWWWAIRPKTLLVSLSPIIVGTALAAMHVAHINWLLAISAWCAVFFLQVGTNLVNDVLDFSKGADTAQRLGPQRMTQAGLLSMRQVFWGGVGCFVLALLCGIPLVMAGGWPFVAVLVASVICGYCYTGGPYPLAYLGLGDLFAFLFFGPIGVSAVYFLQTHTVDAFAILAGVQLGLLTAVPNAINNLRDIDTDRLVHKRTLAVRFGSKFACWEISLLTVLAFLIGSFWIFFDHAMMAILPLVAAPLAYQNLIAILQTAPSVRYNLFLARSAQVQLLFALFLAIGALMS